MGVRTLKKGTFDAIRRELIETKIPQEEIAADYNVSSSTVSLINNTRSWGNYRANKKAKEPLRERLAKAAAPKPTKFEQAELQGLHPVTHEQRVEAKFAKELTQLQKRWELHDASLRRNLPVLARLDDGLRAANKDAKRLEAYLEDRIDTVARNMNRKADAPSDTEARLDVVFSWGVALLALIALIVAIVK